MESSLSLGNKKPIASFKIVGWTLAIAPLCLMLAAANTPVCAQTSDDVSNSTAAPSSPADWSQFHRDNMQRWNPYESVLNVGNVANLQLKWKIPIVEYSSEASSPAVVNGVVYVGGDDHNVYALNTSTGAKLWSYHTGGNVNSSPAVLNGAVYFGSFDHNVYALNANTGVLLWSYATGNRVNSSPAVVNGAVYVGSDDGNLYALNASTGAKLWSLTTGSIVHSSPAVTNGVVYVGSDDGNLYALNASSGALIWKYGISLSAVESSPAVANGIVYFGADNGNIYALNAGTGALLWSSNISSNFGGGYVLSSLAEANGVVYASSFNGNLYALNASTGAILWNFHTGFADPSSPAVANGVVYFAPTDGSVLGLNASTGAKLWSYSIEGGNSSPTVVDGVVYINAGVTDGGHVYAFSLGSAIPADLFLRILPSTTTIHQGDLLTYAFPVWNLGPANADHEVLNTQVPAGTTFDYVRISGTPGVGMCTYPPFAGTGQIVCHENNSMAPNTTWTVRLTVKVTAPAGTVITENAATMSDTPDPNMANNTATVSLKVQ